MYAHLVEEDVLAITTLGRKVFKISVLVDAMLLAELLPELASNCGNSRSVTLPCGRFGLQGGDEVPLFPHWPAWIVMISLPQVSSWIVRDRGYAYLGIVESIRSS